MTDADITRIVEVAQQTARPWRHDLREYKYHLVKSIMEELAGRLTLDEFFDRVCT